MNGFEPLTQELKRSMCSYLCIQFVYVSLRAVVADQALSLHEDNYLSQKQEALKPHHLMLKFAL